MKRTTTRMTAAVAMLCAVVATVGCSNKNKDAQMAATPGVTDVSVAPSPIPVEPVAPVAAQPVYSDAPTQAPAAPVAAAGAGGKYTVQKGDTLWKIATASYGNGNQWQRIAAANPGLSPGTLKAGQTITLP